MNFDRHNGERTKKRAKTAKRMRKHRAEAAEKPLRKCDAASVTNASPEKRREEKSKESTNVLSTRGGFVRPSEEEVAAYCNERGNSVDAKAFFDFYESKGWKIGQNAMKDWRAAVRTWERNRNNGAPRNGNSGTREPIFRQIKPAGEDPALDPDTPY